MPTAYYRLNGNRLTLAELWRVRRNFPWFVAAAVLKPFGAPQFHFSIPRTESLLYVEWDDLPDACVRQFKEPIQGFERVGFDYVSCYEHPVLEPTRRAVAALLLPPDGFALGVVNYIREPLGHASRFGCITFFETGPIGITTTFKQSLNSMPHIHSRRHPLATAEEICRLHQDHLNEWAAAGLTPVKLDATTAGQRILHLEQSIIDFHAHRGVYVPLSKDEVRRLRRSRDD